MYNKKEIMEANELRLGNYIRNMYGEVIKVDLKVLKQVYKGELFGVVQVTDKILTDLGGRIVPLIKGVIFDRFRFIWREEYKYWYVVDHQDGTYITKIEFLHELQNFSRFINGKELEVNL